MKKILYVSRDLTHMYFHIKYLMHLRDKGYEVHIACNINKDIDEFISEGIKVHNIDFARRTISKDHLLAYKQLKQLQNDEKFDLVHFHTPIAAFIGRAALRKFDVKTIYTAHGLHFFKGSPIANWIIYYPLEKIAARWTDAIILINKEDFNLVKKNFSLRGNKIFYINGVGINVSDFNHSDKEIYIYKEKLFISDDEFVVTCVGELNKNKNQIQLLKAYNMCRNKDKIKVFIVGEGDLEQNLKEYCKNNSLNNVTFLGYRRDVAQILSVSDILALVSKREGLPKSLMEGMAAGVALLGNNIRGTRDVISKNNGYIVEVDDYKTLSAKIDYMYENIDKLKVIKQYNRTDAEKYDINIINKDLDDILRDMI
ncbi:MULTISPECIES: glycosyltransferase family 4 protein [Clostridium]|uniref:Glycosyl transferase family 1 n=1 Tax=Clostridium paraputrificum TaxID=29363 RepID=A0A1B8RS47_9CLOT|nr:MULTISPECIES: glycosyltransferase family 4 protein [Clostridium]MDB2103272.1 glycosyltransferase family 4 protein [Clostridium paraputrificum]MDB2124201.1 glycosyltransferase family 4 protein [Clostridium paraputrificum]MDC0801337.1 glycosyltransferase family 4 protein [Clostridium paraputrificum]MDU1585092.1 glycosyltransferase family 4 protein [Clostridium sp.]MDU6520995.1 glycosyltransferase family 4 protein [Clostridium sp.]